MKRLFVSICFAILLIAGPNLHAQVKVITLWPNKVPGAIANDNYKEVSDSDQYWSWMNNVSEPRIDYYPAPAKKANGTAVIICPGGGYGCLATKHEGSQIAAWFNNMGITAFVLKYRLPSDLIMQNKSIGPLQDAQEAVRLVRRRAKEWKIDPHKIGIMGFSAGGHLASTLSTHFNQKVYESSDTTSARPDFSLLIYPVITMDSAFTHAGSRENLLGKNPGKDLITLYSNELQVNALTPPAFIIHSLDDNVVPVQNSIGYALAMKKFNVPCELHIYQQGGHGYGLGRGDNTETNWPKTCKKWLKARGFL